MFLIYDRNYYSRIFLDFLNYYSTFRKYFCSSIIVVPKSFLGDSSLRFSYLLFYIRNCLFIDVYTRICLKYFIII